MHLRQILATAAALVASSYASSLADLCTVSNVQAALPSNGTLLGMNLIPSAVTASPLYNASTGGMGSSMETYNYCNVTVTYARPGKTNVVVKYAFPDPATFANRFYVAGGGGYSLSSDATGGLAYGAVGGATSAGYDAFENSYIDIALYGNGSVNWDATYMFAYQALGEMTLLGKLLTKGFYGLSDTAKIYTYYEGCSDGGREGMSQVQRWGEEYDGVITGAPAFRFAQQQVLHVFPVTVEQSMDYLPPPCELDKIVNATIAACDPLDGRTDGIVSRTDLCQLQFNMTSIIGESYYCEEETATALGFNFSKRQAGATGGAPGSSSSYQPAQNGTVTAEGVAVAQAIYNGLFDSSDQRAYLSWQIASELGDAATTWSNATNAWVLDIPSTGGEYVTKFVQELNLTNLANIDNVTYDTLVDWMNIGFERYLDSLQTTLPNLTPFQQSGGKLLHYHGESDPSVPAASSVHYWQSVQSIMYGNLTQEESLAELEEWYQLYLVPGAAHCGVNSLQPGVYPYNNMNIMIDWVENGIRPDRLNATAKTGPLAGETWMLCQWPSRPLWSSDTTFDCVNDSAALDTWTYDFPAFKVPVY